MNVSSPISDLIHLSEISLWVIKMLYLYCLFSQISGITLLGNPSEVYSHGTQYLMSAGTYVVGSFIIIYIYLPVFYELQATSIFEVGNLGSDQQ